MDCSSKKTAAIHSITQQARNLTQKRDFEKQHKPVVNLNYQVNH